MHAMGTHYNLDTGARMESVIDEQAYAHTPVWNMTFSFINSMSLKCALELGIADAIHSHGKPIPLSLLLSKLSIPPTRAECFRRIMLLLIHSGFFSHQTPAPESDLEEETYGLTAISSAMFVKEKADHCLSTFLRFVLCPEMVTPCLGLGAWLTAREDVAATAFDLAHREPIFEFAQKHAEFSSIFNEAMATDSRLVVQLIIREHDNIFLGLNRLVDVGGGSGVMALALSEAFPQLRCVVLDLPHVVASVQEETSTKKVEFIGGDMFQYIPPADAVVLKWILHDWGDEECVRILQNCKEAIPSKEEGGKVIIIKNVMDTYSSACTAEVVAVRLLFDVYMQSVVPGKERSEAELKKIFTAAGFVDYKITPIMNSGFVDYEITPIMNFRSIIELYY